jgi:hypothetical protein
MPKYEVWWESTTQHRAVVKADNLDEARDVGWLAMDAGDIEFEACDTEWDYVGVNLVDGE